MRPKAERHALWKRPGSNPGPWVPKQMEHMKEYHKENNITFVKSKEIIGSYFWKEILLYTTLLKWYLEHGLKITAFHVGIDSIEYESVKCFQIFADEVSDARRAGDGNSAYGKTIDNNEGLYQQLTQLRKIFLRKLTIQDLKT